MFIIIMMAVIDDYRRFKLWDPEMGGGSGMKYPTQRTINFGFQMTINN